MMVLNCLKYDRNHFEKENTVQSVLWATYNYNQIIIIVHLGYGFISETFVFVMQAFKNVDLSANIGFHMERVISNSQIFHIGAS